MHFAILLNSSLQTNDLVPKTEEKRLRKHCGKGRNAKKQISFTFPNIFNPFPKNSWFKQSRKRKVL